MAGFRGKVDEKNHSNWFSRYTPKQPPPLGSHFMSPAFREKKQIWLQKKVVNGDAEFNRGTKVEQPCSDEKTHWLGTFFEVGEQISGLIRHTLKNDLPVARGWFTVKNNKTILSLGSPSTEASNFAVVVGRGKRRNLDQNNWSTAHKQSTVTLQL